jgi:hypothetical protein
MRILTVRQPWAWGILSAGKDVENRVRNIAGAYRGPVAIHVGLRYDYDWRSAALDDAMRPVRNEAARRAFAEGTSAVRHPLPWEQSLGSIIGVVDLVDVHDARATASGVLVDWTGHTEAGELCSAWAMWDHRHLVLANPRPLPEPIAYRGALGLRRLDDDTIAQITEALA